MKEHLIILRDYVVKNSVMKNGVLVLPDCWYYQETAKGLCAITSNLNTERLVTGQDFRNLRQYVKSELEKPEERQLYGFEEKLAQPRIDWLNDKIANYDLVGVA